MPNSSGWNQYKKRPAPPNAIVSDALLRWQRLGYRIPEQRAMLQKQFNYSISTRSFSRLRDGLGIPTSNFTRKMDDSVLTEEIRSVIGIGGEEPFREPGEDLFGMGVRRTRDHLAVEKNLIVSHRLVRNKLQEIDPVGVANRWPGAHIIHRAVLQSRGWADEWSGDGHEKLAYRGLGLGSAISFEIYGIKDKFTGAFVALDCVPNARHRATVGHVYLNAVEREGGCPRKLVVDCGTETNDAIQAQISFRSFFAPELDASEFPPFARIRSVHNTVIEGAWSKFGSLEGRPLRNVIMSRAKEVDLEDEDQVLLFRWVWSQIVQARLDIYVEVHNTSRVRNQPSKKMPSGHRPILAKEGAMGGENCLVPVDPQAIAYVRESLGPPQCFYDEDFDRRAWRAHEVLGSPELTRGRGWEIYFALLPLLRGEM